jgi:hypothetical protein
MCGLHIMMQTAVFQHSAAHRPLAPCGNICSISLEQCECWCWRTATRSPQSTQTCSFFKVFVSCTTPEHAYTLEATLPYGASNPSRCISRGPCGSARSELV